MTATAKHESGTTLGAHPELYPYVMQHINESAVRAELRDEVGKNEQAIMMGAPDEASFLAWLVGLTGAKKLIEVGVFRGTTTLALAEALPAGGVVVGLDISADYAAMGKAAWAKAGVADKIDFRVGPAVASLEAMVAQPGEANSYDLAFIDADKVNYDNYYELLLKLIRPGGVIAVDNVLWHGEVLHPTTDDARAIVALDAKLRADTRVSATMLPIADGLYLCRKL